MITGTMVAYYFHCHRHLWLFANQINMEFNSDTVQMGKLISESSYSRETHEIKIDSISLDYFDKRQKVIHEIKKTDKMEMLHLRQVQYYILVLEQKGIEGVTGVIDYPKLRKRLKVKVDDDSRKIVQDALTDIERILALDQPPAKVYKKFCRKCSYFELCYID